MKYYVEITLLPSVDIGLFFLWEKVFQKIHIELVKIKSLNGKVAIGISFPEYDTENNRLGGKLRLFATNEATLEKMEVHECLKGFTDYVHLTRVRPVPDNVSKYACYKRQQPKSSNERLARRKSKREGITPEQALKILERYPEQRVKTPFINMGSQSSKQRFKLFVLKQDSGQLVNDGFTCYGLSSKSTVPDF